MSRQVVRDLKRAAAGGCQKVARESALTLLKRSIKFGHVRLAVIRLGEAVAVGAEVPADQWSYCRHAADATREQAVQDLFLAAAQRAHSEVH